MGPGTDVLRLGFSGILPSTNTVDAIEGVIRYTASSSGGRIDLEDGADTTADTFHQNQNSVGASPSDNLFGPGGSLQFSGIIDFGASSPALRINLGSGGDTIFSEPLAVARLNVNGGNPTSVPGDNFRLSLAGVTSPVLTPNGVGAGTYTFGNAGAVNYISFESASTYVPGDFSGNGVVGPEDYAVWKANFGMAVAPGTLGDGNGDGVVDAADFTVWRDNLGAGAGSGSAGNTDQDVSKANFGAILGGGEPTQSTSSNQTTPDKIVSKTAEPATDERPVIGRLGPTTFPLPNDLLKQFDTRQPYDRALAAFSSQLEFTDSPVGPPTARHGAARSSKIRSVVATLRAEKLPPAIVALDTTSANWQHAVGTWNQLRFGRLCRASNR